MKHFEYSLNQLKNICPPQKYLWLKILRHEIRILIKDGPTYCRYKIFYGFIHWFCCTWLSPQDLINDLNTIGLFFENMWIRALRINADTLDGNVYHYRDKAEWKQLLCYQQVKENHIEQSASSNAEVCILLPKMNDSSKQNGRNLDNPRLQRTSADIPQAIDDQNCHDCRRKNFT